MGSGLAGMAWATFVLLEGVSAKLAFVEADEGKRKGETMDLK